MQRCVFEKKLLHCYWQPRWGELHEVQRTVRWIVDLDDATLKACNMLLHLQMCWMWSRPGWLQTKCYANM